MECDYILTLWLILLAALNSIGIAPKLLALWKLKTYNINDDETYLMRCLWLFIRCNLYYLNHKISQAIFVTYLLGILPFCYAHLMKCKTVYIVEITGIILSFFVIRTIFCFTRFLIQFGQL